MYIHVHKNVLIDLKTMQWKMSFSYVYNTIGTDIIELNMQKAVDLLG